MKIRIILCMFLFNAFMLVDLLAQQMPLVYEVENTGADCPKPPLLSFEQLSTIQALPDPFAWSDGRGRISSFSDWRYRRAEISAEVQRYELGTKPAPPSPSNLQASFSQGKLTVIVTEGTNSLTLTATINLPTSGTGPFPAVIGVGGGTGSLPSDIFTNRGIATISYNYGEVAPWTQSLRGQGAFYTLYPDTKVGYFSAWAWGISRIIDGLERVAEANIDIKHLAVTGCSFAGKIALFSGALDERIALTIPEEPGGGGDAAWRVTETLSGSRETLRNAQSYFWYYKDVNLFNDAVTKLPYDHHEVMAMVAPRALFVLGNPDQEWLADESGYVASKAAQEVWNALGVPDRFGFSKVGGHDHCQFPDSQRPELIAFVEKFLLGINTTNTNISISPFNTNLSRWITWTTPTLSNIPSYFSQASLVYPSNLQKDLDKNIIFKWKKVKDAGKYLIQLSLDPTFKDIAKSDSTTTDTVKTITNLVDGKKYFWRVQVKNSTGSSGPWSEIWNFSTFIPLPATPQLVSATPYPNRTGWITFKWNKVKYADQYFIQVSDEESFATIFKSDSTTSDTAKTLSGHTEGQNYYWRVQAKNVEGSSSWSEVSSTLTDVKEVKIPTEYSISQNYPNPFNPTTKLKFTLPQRSLTKLIIYDLLGREIQTIINKELEAGYHEISFDANNFPSGVYYYRIQSGDFIQTKKMILIK